MMFDEMTLKTPNEVASTLSPIDSIHLDPSISYVVQLPLNSSKPTPAPAIDEIVKTITRDTIACFDTENGYILLKTMWMRIMRWSIMVC